MGSDSLILEGNRREGNKADETGYGQDNPVDVLRYDEAMTGKSSSRDMAILILTEEDDELDSFKGKTARKEDAAKVARVGDGSGLGREYLAKLD